MVVFLVLYVDDILLIRNNVELSSSVKIWLSESYYNLDTILQ